MSKKNSKMRKRLKQIYGDGCFLERMGVRTIKGIKPMDRMITYHHLRKKSKGGKATIENGANLAWENHEWLHSLPEEHQEKINDQIRGWKANFVTMKGNGEILASAQMDFPNLTKEEDCIIIELQNTTPEQYQELQKQKEIREKKQKFNRSNEKRKLRKIVNELLEEGEIEL